MASPEYKAPECDPWLQEYYSAIPQILSHYRLPAYTTEFLRVNENIVFGVTERETGNRYALRLHRSRDCAFRQVCRDSAFIISELLWLEAIANETSIVAPQPVRTSDGGMITHISDSMGSSVSCSLLRWVEGCDFDKNAPNSALLAREMGRTLARLQEHGRTWIKPEGFIRPSYNQQRLAESINLIGDGIERDLLNQNDYEIIRQTAQHVSSVMGDLGTSNEVWGLSHFDLGGGNCLVFNHGIRLIDFSLCGFGHYLFDLAGALGYLPVQLRQPCLEGYAELARLPENHIQLLDAFLLMGVFSCWAFHIGNSNQHHWIQPHIAKVIVNKCCPILNGESFILRIP